MQRVCNEDFLSLHLRCKIETKDDAFVSLKGITHRKKYKKFSLLKLS